VNEVPEAASIGTRLERAASLPDVLAAGFDAFEAIRVTARHYQDQVPALFAAFMTTADAPQPWTTSPPPSTRPAAR
jgi:hypothetical protein